MDYINPWAVRHQPPEARASMKSYRELTLYLILLLLFDAKIAIALAAYNIVRWNFIKQVPEEHIELLHSYLQVWRSLDLYAASFAPLTRAKALVFLVHVMRDVLEGAEAYVIRGWGEGDDGGVRWDDGGDWEGMEMEGGEAL